MQSGLAEWRFAGIAVAGIVGNGLPGIVAEAVCLERVFVVAA